MFAGRSHLRNGGGGLKNLRVHDVFGSRGVQWTPDLAESAQKPSLSPKPNGECTTERYPDDVWSTMSAPGCSLRNSCYRNSRPSWQRPLARRASREGRKRANRAASTGKYALGLIAANGRADRLESIAAQSAPELIMQRRYQGSIQCAGILLAMLSLAACGGLPQGGERTVSTAMKGNARYRVGGGGAAARRGASRGIRPSPAGGWPRRHRGPTRPGGCGAAQPGCAVFYLEQGSGRQGSIRTSAPRGRPRRARAPVAR